MDSLLENSRIPLNNFYMGRWFLEKTECSSKLLSTLIYKNMTEKDQGSMRVIQPW